ncbi:ATP-binding protein [Roseiconus lacunae]|uniref:ATP-binding protein n=1 Tax=Roseiconus lacunae TaxID=2605694 RepID=UPI00308C61D4|nr:ATP-binding protein [Stieleria sp. HD01]
MFASAIRYIVLPQSVSDFEQSYLAKMNRIFTIVFALHLPVFVAIAYFNDTGPIEAALLTGAVVIGPVIARLTMRSKRAISVVIGVASMFMGGVLVHLGQGPVQIEMHFYFFVLLALLAVFANPLVIVAAAVTAALHHLLLWFLLPASVFNYDAPIWVVGVHAAFVVLESVAAIFIARSFFDNVIGLEKIVALRTSELESRHRDMRMILNSVDQGFMTINRQGVIQDERSSAVEMMFGPIKHGDTIADVIARYDAKAAEWLQFGLDEVFEGIMPVEVTLDQLPDHIVIQGQTFALKYHPVEDCDLSHLTIVVSDITAEVERKRLEADSREMIRMLEGITKDRTGFLEFFHEASELIDSLRCDEREELESVKRQVHTLKGNAAIFGLDRLADVCHAVETAIAEEDGIPEGTVWTELFSCWAHVRGNLRRLISDTDHEFRVTDSQYKQLLLGLLNREPMESLAPLVAAWKLEPTESRLQRVSHQAKRIATQMGKEAIVVSIRSGNLRTEASHWSPFWSSLIHAVRNAVDHGIESIEDRRLEGKPDCGKLTLSTDVQDDRFIVTVADDGRGINWDHVASLAAERGLPHETEQDLTNALFANGLSTAESVSLVSGRGIGLGALRQATEKLGGTIKIESRLGRGTQYRFEFPIDVMAPDTYRLLTSYGIDADLSAITS